MSRVDTDGRPYERSYFRVRCALAIRTKPVPPSHVEALEREILQRRDPRDLSQLDPDVASWLDRLEQKLDHILLHLGAVDEHIRPHSVESVVLSGGGIRLQASEPRDVGDMLLVEFELPGIAAHLVRCLASVVAFYSSDDGQDEVAVTFQTIHPQDREAVVQHTLAVERGAQRSRADERVAS